MSKNNKRKQSSRKSTRKQSSRKSTRKQSSRKSTRKQSSRKSIRRLSKSSNKKKSKTKSSIKKRKKLEKYKLKKINNNIKIKKKLKGGNAELLNEMKEIIKSHEGTSVKNEEMNLLFFDLSYKNDDSEYLWKDITIQLEDKYVYIYWGPTNDFCIRGMIYNWNETFSNLADRTGQFKIINIEDFFFYKEGNFESCNKLFHGLSKSIDKVSIGIVGMSLMVYIGLILKLDEMWLVDQHKKTLEDEHKRDCSYYSSQFKFERVKDTSQCFFDLSKQRYDTDYIFFYSESKEKSLYKPKKQNKIPIEIKDSQFKPS